MPKTAAATRKKLRVLDFDLPLLSSRAAIELDNLLLDQGDSVAAVSRLADRLEESFDAQHGDGPARLLTLDTSTFSVFSDALNEAEWNGGAKTVEDVIDEAWDVAQALRRVSEEGSAVGTDLLARARDFCIVLSRLTSSYRQSVYESGPQHPYKK